MSLYLEIHVRGGNPERHELIGERITVGTAANAAIRLGAVKGSAPELIAIYPGKYNIRVEVATGSEGSLVFEGAPHRQVCVPFGGEVFIGPGRLTFLDVERRQRSPVVLLGVAVALILIGLGVYQASNPEDPATREVSIAQLLDGQSAEICAESQPDAALSRAQSDERAAYAKLESSAFVTEDGVESVTLLRRAAACYEATQMKEDDGRIRAELQHQTGRLNELYSTLRLRLRLALEKNRFREALDATRDIQALLSAQPDSAYRRWLKDLEHSLERRVTQSDS